MTTRETYNAIIYKTPKQELARFCAQEFWTKPEYKATAGKLFKALTKYGAQAEYIETLINVWFTAHAACIQADDTIAKSVFVGSEKFAAMKIADLLRRCDVEMTDVDELELEYFLDMAWSAFENKRVKQGESNNEQ